MTPSILLFIGMCIVVAKLFVERCVIATKLVHQSIGSWSWRRLHC